MKKFIWIIILFTAFLFYGSSRASSVFAASLELDPTTKSANTNDIIELNLNVDPGSEQITSVDAYIEYDETMLEFQSIANGDYFPTFFEDSSTTGKAYYGGMVNLGEFKTGEGTIATLSFKALKEGTTTVSIYCDTSKNDTSKINKNDFDATNIITCSENISSEITVGEGDEEVTSTPIPTSTTVPAEDEETEEGGTGGTTLQETPTTLPQSGIFDNVIKYSAPGIALLLIGLVLKLLL